ncbi:hypothetical protein JOM56_009906 [Amanita muscaria]
MAALNCSHVSRIAALSHPKLSQAVHREECTQCFDNQDLPAGIDLCLTCFNGACPRLHAQIHVQKSNHPFTLNIHRVPNPNSTSRDDNEPPAKMAKLAIQEEPSEHEKYQFITTIKCWMCEPVQGLPVPEAAQDAKVDALIEACISSLSSARQSEVKAWEEEILPCEHTLTLEQYSSGPIADSGLAHCADCHLPANLWLCLTCGNLGCGRQQLGGLEGNGHGLKHFEATGHRVAVKLGTITPEGDADVYCYACDDTKEDPNIATHLDAFGIHIHSLKKTEKSITELQIEQNLSYEFSLTSHSGEAFEPVHGPGLTGLANLGNSCYIASILQTTFSLPAFQKRYFSQSSNNQFDPTHAQECTYSLPAECVECQMRKVADGLLSGRYAIPVQPPPKPSETNTQISSDPPSHPPPVFQAGIRPMTFKSLIGANHAEFSTMRQQDAEEFFGHLLSIIRRDSKRRGIPLASDQDATRVFEFGTEQKIKCNVCGRVRYRIDEMDRVGVAVPAVPLPDPVPPITDKSISTEAPKNKEYKPVSLQTCIDSVFLSKEPLEYTCPGGCGSVIAIKQSRFASFPDILVIHAKKFELVNWVPTKLDIPVILPENDTLVFGDQYLGTGLQSGEVELPDDAGGGGQRKSALPPVNEALLADMEGMGFPRVRCEKALRATGNTGLEAAMEWVFAHMDDADIDVPETGGGGGGGGKPEPPADMVAMLADMGFTDKQAKKALRETASNMERAVEWLFSHPDDNGEDDGGDPSSSSAAPATTQNTEIRGSREVPAQFVLKAFVSHKGPSVHTGHYVAHVKVPTSENQQGEWVLFNDEKVVRADEESVNELKPLAYLYVFERVGA